MLMSEGPMYRCVGGGYVCAKGVGVFMLDMADSL